MKKKQGKTKKSEIRWHRWFGTVLEDTLKPLGLEVNTEFSVMADPPKADLVFIRKKGAGWTPDQLEYLPDGIRESRTGHIITEFKNTESLTDSLLCKTAAYGEFYKDHHKLGDHDVQVFLASSKTPYRSTLENYGYRVSDKAGVYHSRYPIVRSVTLICLNNLADEPHNALCRLFASRKREKMKALLRLLRRGVAPLPETVRLFITGVADFLFRKGGADMRELTSEERAMLTRVFHNLVIPNMPVEDVLKGIPVEDRLKGLTLEELDEIEACLQELKRQKTKTEH